MSINQSTICVNDFENGVRVFNQIARHPTIGYIFCENLSGNDKTC